MKRKRYRKRQMFLILLLFCIIAVPIVNAYAAPSMKLSSKKVTVYVGKEKKLKLENNRQKVVWTVTQGEKNIGLKNKSKNGVTLIGKKEGIAKVTAQVGKKKFWCTVTIKKAKPTQQTDITDQSADLIDLQIIVGKQTFSAKLYKNKTTQALIKKLPLTLNMSELNGNEKYYYLSEALPTDAKSVSRIEKGDIMLYGLDCLVLFYDSFNTSYQYTPLGYLENVSGFEKALGSGKVEVTFKINS